MSLPLLPVRWRGAALPPRLAAALRGHGVLAQRAPEGGDAGEEAAAGTVTILASAAGRKPPPARPGDGPWLWVARGPLAPAAVRAAVLLGAYDAVSLDDPDATARLADRALELAAAEPVPPPTAAFVAESRAARDVLRQLARAALTSQPVLLTGETGTGKDVCARLVHEWSRRSARRFVAINCAAIPNELIESELFGHAKGAFSGAVRDYEGQIAAAEGGTVFLDEIDDTPKSLQVKLLRVLEDRVISRLGENEWRTIDFRLVAATNRDLRRMVADGDFGGDLYERLAIVAITLPPLRERPEDLAPLVAHFLARYAELEPPAPGRARVDGVAPDALAALAAYPWPGNVRELRNVVFQALVNKRGGAELLLSDLPRRVLGAAEAPPLGVAAAGGAPVVDRAALARAIDAGGFRLRAVLETLERAALELALDRAAGNATGAARLLGEVGRGTAADPGGTVRAMMRRLRVPARR